MLSILPQLQPLATTHLLSVSMDWFTYSRYFTEMKSYSMWPFVSGIFHMGCFWGSFTLKHLLALHSFLCLNDIPLYGYTTVCLYIQQLMDIWVVSTFWQVWIVRLFSVQVKNILVQVFVWVPVFTSLGIYLGMELLGHMAALCLTYWGTAKLFSTAAVPFYIPTSNVWGFQFFHMLANTCYFLFFDYSHPSGYESGISLWFWFAFPHD